MIGLRQVTLQRSVLLDSIGSTWCSVTWNRLDRQNHNFGFKTSMWKYYVFDWMSHPTHVISLLLKAKRYVLISIKYLIPLTCLKITFFLILQKLSIFKDKIVIFRIFLSQQIITWFLNNHVIFFIICDVNFLGYTTADLEWIP